MKKNCYWKSRHGYLCSTMLVLVTFCLCFVGCKDDDEQGGTFDPDKPVVITDFMPKEGGFGSNLILYGDNFGNDISKIKVIIGGKDAKVVNVNNQSLYCVIPAKSYEGDIQVSVLDDNGEAIAHCEAEGNFKYEKKWLVSTFLGTRYEVSSDFLEKEGPFNDCGGFGNVFWFSFDPASKFDRLYFTTEGTNCRVIDFEKEYVSYFPTGFDKVTVMSWTDDEKQDMIISHNHSSDTKIGNYLFSRESDFTQKESIGGYARGVNGTMVHPENGELYYSRFRAGDVWRHDFETGEDKLAFVNPYSGVAIYLVTHPTGKYAYMLEQEKYYIMRTDYDWDKKTFTTPYTICGQADKWGYEDGVGTKALLNRPIQGVFVKNPDYAGQDDEYDFYFCDKNNHAVRKLTPQGRVSTFAGRGNNGISGYANGDLRKEARFNEPRAITYDEKRECFYIGDGLNKVIRKIAKEE